MMIILYLKLFLDFLLEDFHPIVASSFLPMLSNEEEETA